jgi:hypothetical protein
MEFYILLFVLWVGLACCISLYWDVVLKPFNLTKEEIEKLSVPRLVGMVLYLGLIRFLTLPVRVFKSL